MDPSQTHQLHFLIVPLMSQSHLIPFTDLAKQLANTGTNVTIMMTPLNAARYESIVKHSDLRIQFISFQFSCLECGLPLGCENSDSLPSPDLMPEFFKASNMLQDPLEKWIGELNSPPSCLISDYCLPWTEEVALKFKIPRVVFQGISCFTMFCSYNIHRSRVRDTVESDTEMFLVPDIPDRIEFNRAQLPRQTISRKKNAKEMDDLSSSFKAAECSSEGILVNSFEELEYNYVQGYKNVVKNIWCVGPLSLCNKTTIDEPEWFNWLNSMKPGSVIYVCFGSLCHLSFTQLVNIGLGLEASNHPFIWVIRKENHSREMEKWMVEEKFEDRVKGRGVVIKGWAPQVLILSNQSVGGFLTHCGWNSTLEGVSAGLPMLTWPMSAEQFYNENLVVQVLKTGVGIGADVCLKWAVETNWDVVKKGVEVLMDEGEEGEERRKRASEIGKIANRAVQEGGSSCLNVQLFIQHVMSMKK